MELVIKYGVIEQVGYRCRKFALPQMVVRGIVGGGKKGDDANKSRYF